MRKLPLAAFAALVVATVAAFFVVQHLKVTTPLLDGLPVPFPGSINPVSGRTCVVKAPNGQTGPVSFRRMRVSFYLLHRADDVDVYVVDQAGQIVATLASGRHMGIRRRVWFTWNGREDDGSVAPDGTYYVKVALIHQGRTYEISTSGGSPEPVHVITTPPHPRVISVSPPRLAAPARIRIAYTGARRAMVRTVVVYRTDLPGPPREVKSFGAGPPTGAVWDGEIHMRPAPQGVYLMGLEVTDRACNFGRFPHSRNPDAGSTPHAGVTIAYLEAMPPLDPVASGGMASVGVEADAARYSWTLRRDGHRVSEGTGRGPQLQFRLPGRTAGLYELGLRTGSHTTSVPLVAAGAAGAKPAKVLVILPALTWQGQNPADEDGDGIPDTLDNVRAVSMQRPLLDGPPPGLADEAGLVSYLDRARIGYDLTTDLALAAGTGPALRGHRVVVLAGSERWLPGSVMRALRSFVEGGGRVLSLGQASLQRQVTVGAGTASKPTAPTSVDALGALRGVLTATHGRAISATSDALGLLPASLSGYPSYEPVTPAAAAALAAAAAPPGGPPAIVAYRLGSGIVIDVGLTGFGSSLAHDKAAQGLVKRSLS